MWLALDGGPPPRMLGWTSISRGVVNLVERFGGREVSVEIYHAMVADVEAALRPFGARHGIGRDVDGVHLLGTSSTVATLAAMHLELPKYDRMRLDGTWLTRDDVYAVTARLRAMNYQARLDHACIRRGRADLVIAGCAILEAIVRACPVARLRVAGRGLREGILLAMMRPADGEAALAASA
jgi:exopolyphosphatase/guanosine-5'-triphosphate,3'-diphosphate pyrophosphatase